MNSMAFVKKIILNSITALFYFGFKYIWLIFKSMRGRPIIISQLKSIAMIIIPVFVFLRCPIHILVCAYCVAAMIYGIYDAYKDEMMYELAYWQRKSYLRSMVLNNASMENRNEQIEQEREREERKNANEPSENNQPTGFCAFNDSMSLEEGKAKYHQLMKMGHPDNGGDEAFTQSITAQYDEFCKKHQSGPKFCPHCGTQFSDTAVFCSKCGTKIEK